MFAIRKIQRTFISVKLRQGIISMGYVNTQITIKNIDDIKQAGKGNLPEFLLGVLPLEGMDLIVNTVNRRA
jgi:hypothetical protein